MLFSERRKQDAESCESAVSKRLAAFSILKFSPAWEPVLSNACKMSLKPRYFAAVDLPDGVD